MIAFVGEFVSLFANILYLALIGRVVISWLNVSSENPIAKIVFQITEPILSPLRKVLPTVGMLDFSPMVAIFVVILIQGLIVALI